VLQPNIKISKSVVCQTDILVPPVSRKVKVFNEGSQTTVVNSNAIGTQTEPPICGPNLTPDKTIQENKTGFFNNMFNKKPAKTIAFERGTQTDPNFELPQELLNLYGKSKGGGPTMITTETQTVPIIIQKPQVRSPPSPPSPPGFLERIGLGNKKDKKVKLVTTGQQTDPVFVRAAREYENIFTVNSQYFDERVKIFLAKTKFNEPIFYPEIDENTVPPSPVYLTRKPEFQEELVYATKYKPEKSIQPSPFRHTEIIYSQEYLEQLKYLQYLQRQEKQQMQQVQQVQQKQQMQQVQQMQQRQQMQQVQQRQQMQQKQQMQQMQQKQVKFKSSR